MILPNPDHLYSPTSAADTNSSTPVSVGDAGEDRAELTALVRKAQKGDLGAQSELVRRYQRRLAGHVRQIVRQPDMVEDLVQTVFIKMVRRLGRLRDAGAFESWLFRLSRNAALDYLRRRRRRPVTVACEEQLNRLPDTDSSAVVTEIMEALTLALEELSPKDRSLVTLFVQGHSYRIIAAREGLTEEAVKARLHRTRPFLRAAISQATAARPTRATRPLPSPSAISAVPSAARLAA